MLLFPQVNLGDGIMCTVSSWNAMSSTTDRTMWANALVLGVFKEEAHRYGLLPRGDKTKFSESFKRIAKCKCLVILNYNFERLDK